MFLDDDQRTTAAAASPTCAIFELLCDFSSLARGHPHCVVAGGHVSDQKNRRIYGQTDRHTTFLKSQEVKIKGGSRNRYFQSYNPMKRRGMEMSWENVLNSPCLPLFEGMD